MNCNTNRGIYVPVHYADMAGYAEPALTGWEQACPVPDNHSNNLPERPQLPAPGEPPVTFPPGGSEENLEDYIFTTGFLRANIGNLLRVEFLIGNNTTDRIGVLSEVGATYIVLESLDGSSRLMCDISSIRFVTIMRPAAESGFTGNFMQP